MFPSEKARNRAMALQKSIPLIFKILAGTGCFIFILGLLLKINNYSMTGRVYTNINGVEHTSYSVFYPGTFIMFFGIGQFTIFLILLLIRKLLHTHKPKDDIAFPISSNYYTPFNLFNSVNTIDSKYLVTVNGNWIDVTYNFPMNSNYKLSSDGRLKYYKLYRINNNRTYDEIDCLFYSNANLSNNFNSNPNTTILARHVKFGKFRYRFSNKTFNGQSYTIDTKDLTNYMRKWFAERGYSEN